MPTDEELNERLAALLDDAPPLPPPERIAALRARAAEARDRHAPVVDATRAKRATAPWLAVAVAAIALAAGFGVATVIDDGGADDVAGDVEYDGPMTGPDDQPVDADLRVVATGIGRVVELRTAALPILPTGELYEVWFVGPDDAPGTPDRISAGTFHPDADGRSDVRFAAAVNPERYPIVEITAEPGDGDPQPTGPVVLRTTIQA